MPSLLNVLLCAAVATLLWTSVGLPVARRVAPARPLALAMAPALGWAVFNAAALPALLLVGFTPSTVTVLCGAVLVLGLAASIVSKSPEPPARPDTSGRSLPGIPWWVYGAAALLALAPAIAIVPKLAGGSVFLTEPMYDHSKVAIIDDIARLGLPAGNPFFGEAGASSPLAYYYLWHFGAAVFATLLGVSGWEADIALTWFTAFASLLLMMGLAVWFARRRSAALWVVLLSLAISLRPVLAALLGEEALGRVLSYYPGLQSWIVQATWVPQHLASATCVVLAVVLISRLADRGGALLILALALVVAAGFESSAWIGGVTFAVAAVMSGLVFLAMAEPRHRLRFLVNAGLAAALAAVVAFPFLRDEYAATAARAVGVPIGFWPYEVLGPIVPDGLRRALDLPAYWLVLLVIEFPAIYLAGSMTLARVVTDRATPAVEKRLATGLAALALAGFAVAWLFISTIANNDLGWRAVLPGVLVLTVFAAAGLSRWIAAPARIATAAAIGLFLLGVPHGLIFIAGNATGIPARSAAVFARTPDLWEAVRRHSAPGDRVGNNPLFLADMVRWPVNISWALLSNRRSCFAGWDLARAYVALPGEKIDELETLFERIFGGGGTPEDIRALATRYDCRLVVVTPSDGAWGRDGFAESAAYRLVEEKAGVWRIYAATGGAPGPL
jgi:hypothetical protein